MRTAHSAHTISKIIPPKILNNSLPIASLFHIVAQQNQKRQSKTSLLANAAAIAEFHYKNTNLFSRLSATQSTNSYSGNIYSALNKISLQNQPIFSSKISQSNVANLQKVASHYKNSNNTFFVNLISQISDTSLEQSLKVVEKAFKNQVKTTSKSHISYDGMVGIFLTIIFFIITMYHSAESENSTKKEFKKERANGFMSNISIIWMDTLKWDGYLKNMQNC